MSIFNDKFFVDCASQKKSKMDEYLAKMGLKA